MECTIPIEIHNYGTDPNEIDTDGNGMDDHWETQYGLNPLSNDSQEDFDQDGIINIREYQLGLAPNVPISIEIILGITFGMSIIGISLLIHKKKNHVKEVAKFLLTLFLLPRKLTVL